VVAHGLAQLGELALAGRPPDPGRGLDRCVLGVGEGRDHGPGADPVAVGEALQRRKLLRGGLGGEPNGLGVIGGEFGAGFGIALGDGGRLGRQVGRASCRERVLLGV
jgi:hypothetical protein